MAIACSFCSEAFSEAATLATSHEAHADDRLKIGLNSFGTFGSAFGKTAARAAAESKSMRIKIRDGTPAHDEATLCATCRHSRVTRGRKLDEELVFCSASHLGSSQITFKVTSCSAYSSQTEPTYYELMQQAWILQPGSRRRPSGFVRASDLRDEELARYMSEARRHDEP